MAATDSQVVGARAESVVVQGGEQAQLKANALSLWDSTVMAVSSTAPAYSLAATMALIAAVVGLASPAVILVSFVPVLGIAIAYFYLNRTNPNCGASYSWLTQAISPFLGWFTGWVQLMASVFFLVSAPTLAGTNTLSFLQAIGWINAATASSPWWTALIGIFWLVLVTVMVIYGITIAARFQWLLLAIEYTIVLLFAVLAFAKVASIHPTGSIVFSWQWLNPFSIKGLDSFAGGIVLAVFFFWGWDTAANVNEETRDAHLTPGRAGIISMFALLFIFLLATSAMQMLLPQKTIADQGGNALQYFAQELAPAPWSYLMLLAILSSTVATMQTTLLPAARLTLSMARDGVWPRSFAHIHPRFRTPWISTVLLGVLCVLGLLLTTVSTSVNATLVSLTSNIGVLVTFYYGITGLACAWYFRGILTRSAVTLIFAGIVPFLSGLFLFWVGVQVVVQGEQASGWGYVLPVLVSFVIGIPLVAIAWLANKQYFAYRAEAYQYPQASVIS